MSGKERLGALGMILGAALIALFILSTRSCSIDAHHQITEQVKACKAQGKTWVDTTDQGSGFGMSGYCK